MCHEIDPSSSTKTIYKSYKPPVSSKSFNTTRSPNIWVYNHEIGRFSLIVGWVLVCLADSQASQNTSKLLHCLVKLGIILPITEKEGWSNLWCHCINSSAEVGWLTLRACSSGWENWLIVQQVQAINQSTSANHFPCAHFLKNTMGWEIGNFTV